MVELRGREALVQRVVLTALADIKLVSRDYELLSATLGSATDSGKCSTSIEGGTARVSLVLERRSELDYGQIAACVNERLSELDILSGRKSKLLRCAPASVKARVTLYRGEANEENEEEADESTSVSIINRALERNPIDRMLGVRDMKIASLEQRLNFLLEMGVAEENGTWLDESVCGHTRPSTRDDGLIPIEELGELGLDEPCCATGCEPCVWEVYYQRQARERKLAAQPAHCQAQEQAQQQCKGAEHVLSWRWARPQPEQQPQTPPQEADVNGTHEGGRKRSRAEADTAEAVEEGSTPTLSPDSMSSFALLSRQQLTAEMILLRFAASVHGEPPVPWHVRLQLRAADGGMVTRAYTALRCEGGPLELLVKIHEGGRCSPALAALSTGEHVQIRGPIATDEQLHVHLRPPLPAPETPPPPSVAVHCISAGSGLSPMVQIGEAVVGALERRADSGSSARVPPSRVIRIWSFHRRASDALLPSDLASLQRRGRAVGVEVHCAFVLTREPLDGGPTLADPCEASGGCATLLRGRPELPRLLEGVPTEEVGSSVLVVCGPDAFNEAMGEAARQRGYAPDRVFVRETPHDGR